MAGNLASRLLMDAGPGITLEHVRSVAAGGGTPTFTVTIPDLADTTFYALISSRTNTGTGTMYQSNFRFTIDSVLYYWTRILGGSTSVNNPQSIWKIAGSNLPRSGDATFTVSYNTSAPVGHGICIYAVKGNHEVLTLGTAAGDYATPIGSKVVDTVWSSSTTPSQPADWTVSDFAANPVTGYAVRNGRIDPVTQPTFNHINAPFIIFNPL